jgi:hypothetical protein
MTVRLARHKMRHIGDAPHSANFWDFAWTEIWTMGLLAFRASWSQRHCGPPRLLDGGDGSPQPAHDVPPAGFGCFGRSRKSKPQPPHVR